MTTLGEVCAIVMGQAPAGDSYNDSEDGLPLIAGAGDFDGTEPAPKKFTSQPTKVSAAGDIVLSIRASIGTKIRVNDTYCLGRGVAGLRAGSRLDQGFLWHWLSYAETSLAAKGRGATFLQVNRNDISDMPIDLPEIHEQRRIASLLDNVEDLRKKRRRAILALDSVAASIFHHRFGLQPSVGKVNDIANFVRTGPFGSQLRHDEFVDTGIAVLGLDNIVGNEFRWRERRYITPEKYEHLRRYTVKQGDVLISIMGTVGRCAVVPNDIPTAINTKHMCAITVDRDRLIPEFLRAAFLWHPEARTHLRRQTKGSIMDGLNMGIIKSMPVPVPDLHKQYEFARQTQLIDKQRVAIQRAQLAEDELFSSLQHRAFRGEL